MDGERCGLCGRVVGEVTRHHLLPKSRTRKLKKKSRKRRGRDLADAARTVALCRPCHRNIHASVDNRELERGYDTLEALAAHPDVRRFTQRIQNKPHGTL